VLYMSSDMLICTKLTSDFSTYIMQDDLFSYDVILCVVNIKDQQCTGHYL